MIEFLDLVAAVAPWVAGAMLLVVLVLVIRFAWGGPSQQEMDEREWNYRRNRDQREAMEQRIKDALRNRP